MTAKADKTGSVVKPANANATRRRFVVMWSANHQDRRSAPMTEQEATAFAERLRKENVASLRIETEDLQIRGTGRLR